MPKVLPQFPENEEIHESIPEGIPQDAAVEGIPEEIPATSKFKV